MLLILFFELNITMVSKPHFCFMVEVTHHAQLANVVFNLKGKTIHLREEQEQQSQLLEAIFQQINNFGSKL